MTLQGKKIGVLIESDYYEPEIWYYQRRVAEEGMEVHFLTRLWGQERITFTGHGMWLVAPTPELVRGRRVDSHNNLLGDVRNMGAEYVNEDVVVDGDLVTGRTGGHAHLFAKKIIELLNESNGQ